VSEADLWTKMIDDINSFTSIVWLELYPRATLSAIRNTVEWFLHLALKRKTARWYRHGNRAAVEEIDVRCVA
jgi:hypothetical protein